MASNRSETPPGPSPSVEHVTGASCPLALSGPGGVSGIFSPASRQVSLQSHKSPLQKRPLRAASGLATPDTPLSCVLSSKVREDQLWGISVGRLRAGTGGLGADASTSPRCWDLSSGNKKWIIQVPILASIVVSRVATGLGGGVGSRPQGRGPDGDQ